MFVSGAGMSTTLVVLPRFPSERSGTGQRSRLLVEGALAAGDTHVVLLDGANRSTSQNTLPGVTSIVSVFSERITPRGRFARSLGGGLRLLAPGFTYAPDTALRATLLDLVKRHRIDTVIFRYAPLFCAAGITAADGLRVLVDVDDRDDQKYQTRLTRLLGPRLVRTWMGQLPLRRLASVLQKRLSQAGHVWFATKEDIWPLGQAQVSLLPNVAFGTPPETVSPPSASLPTLLFVGIFNHLPNRDGVAWFLEQCWPAVARGCPDARLRIVGRGDWASMAGQFPGLTNVAFVGEVADLGPEYEAARVAICPVREGGGSKIKVIEAASYGRPVVATSHSFRGFDGLESDSLGQTDDPAAFAEACLRMLTDPVMADQRGAALRNWQRDTYSKAAFVGRVTQALGS